MMTLYIGRKASKLWKRVCAETSTEINVLAENWKYLLAGLILQFLRRKHLERLEREKAEKVAGAILAGAGVLAGVGVLAGAVGLLSTVGSMPAEETADDKTMKAPGRKDTRMYRSDFAKDPKGYFQDLHRDEKKTHIK